MDQPIDTKFCQRWKEHLHSWRHVSEGGFDHHRFDIGAVPQKDAREFVEAHHYSGSFPAACHCYGLWEGLDLVGVAVLSVPVQKKVLTAVFPGLEPYQESLELGRFVLLDQVPANAESWFLARCWELAAGDGVRGIVSFSDPLSRETADGQVVMPGHIGTIYQATNAEYLGRGTARCLYLLPDGTVLSARSIQKVRSGDRGTAYVERQLQSWGARPLEPGEDRTEWLHEAMGSARIRRVTHPGNHRYAFKIGPKAVKRAVSIALPSQPYPKAIAA